MATLCGQEGRPGVWTVRAACWAPVCRMELTGHAEVLRFLPGLVLLVDNQPQRDLKVKCAPVLGEERDADLATWVWFAISSISVYWRRVRNAGIRVYPRPIKFESAFPQSPQVIRKHFVVWEALYWDYCAVLTWMRGIRMISKVELPEWLRFPDKDFCL